MERAVSAARIGFIFIRCSFEKRLGRTLSGTAKLSIWETQLGLPGLVALSAWLLAALFLATTLATATFAALFALSLSATLALAAALPALVFGLIWHHITPPENWLAT
jgi:hypothetical protein